MRAETDKSKFEAFMVALGNRVRGEGCIYLPGGTYSRYNALVRELVSFESALDRRNRPK